MGLLINFINLNNYFYLFIFILMISLHVISVPNFLFKVVFDAYEMISIKKLHSFFGF